MEIEVQLQKVTAQRDNLARYIFQEDGGALSSDYCRAEVAAGRCQCRDLPYEVGMNIDTCVPCIVELIGKGTPAAADLYFRLLAEHNVLVLCHIIGGRMFTGRVHSVEGDTITLISRTTKRSVISLNQIGVLVPKEVLRWSNDKLTPVRWR